MVVWQGVYDPGQTQEKDGDQGFILLPPQPAVLPRSDAGIDGVEPAPCFVISGHLATTAFTLSDPIFSLMLCQQLAYSNVKT